MNDEETTSWLNVHNLAVRRAWQIEKLEAALRERLKTCYSYHLVPNQHGGHEAVWCPNRAKWEETHGIEDEVYCDEHKPEFGYQPFTDDDEAWALLGDRVEVPA